MTDTSSPQVEQLPEMHQLPAVDDSFICMTNQRPSDKAIILCLMKNWPNATYGNVCDWIIAAAESIQSKP